MLLRFVIEPSTFEDLVLRGDWGTFLGGLESFWPNHGMFVMPEDFDDILDQSSLDRHSIGQWRTFLMAGAKRTLLQKNGGIDWSGIQSWDDLKGVNGQFEIAILQRASTARFRSSADSEYCAHDPADQVTIEISRGDHLLFTCQSRKVQELGSKAVTQEETPSQVWEERLRNHIRHSTSILLVDIYAARRSEGLQFFLEKLVTDGRQPGETLQAVHIYSSYRAFSGTGDGTAASIRKELREGVTRMIAGIGSVVPNLEIQVHLFHEADLPNDRWLRVDDNIIELGHGLEILEPTRSQAFSFKLAGGDSGRQRQESQLKLLCKNHRDDDAVSHGSFSFGVCTRPRRNRR